MSDVAIEVSQLSKRYGALTVVDDVSFSVRTGAVTGFLGPNGAGKTTTLRCVLGLAKASGGSATVLGQPYGQLKDPAHTIGANLEVCGAHPGRSGKQHLRSLAAMASIPDKRVDEVLEIVELAGDAANRRYGKYSMGMRQRLGLAATLLGDPQILVLDEPANGLDPAGIRWLRDMLRATAAEGRTVLVSSHVLAEVAQTVDDVVVIHKGRIVEQGPVSKLVEGSTASVIVRSPGAEKIAEAARGKGLEVHTYGDGSIGIDGMEAAAVGDLAFELGVPLHQLYQSQASLEDVFFKLTTGDGQ
jgi:ABC-2 type transport system ATP-binding protein